LYSQKWKHKILIKVDHTKIKGKEALINFPAKVNITDIMLAKKAHPKGWDFLFTSADGITKLEHKIQHWDNKTGKLIAWVKIPLLSPFEDTMEMFGVVINFGEALKTMIPQIKINMTVLIESTF